MPLNPQEAGEGKFLSGFFPLASQLAKNRIREKTEYGTFEIAVLFPEPRAKISDIPVLVVPGWGTYSIEQYENALFRLAKHRTVIGFYSEGVKEVLLCPFAKKERASPGLLGKAALFSAALHSLDVKKADLVAYSEGSVVSLYAIAHSEVEIRNMILVNPAGLSQKRSFAEFLRDYFGEVFSGVSLAVSDGTFFTRMKRAFRGPVFEIVSRPVKTFRDIRSLAGSDMRSFLRLLRRKGVRFHLIASKDDVLFPPEKYLGFGDERYFRKASVVPGRHSSFIFDPHPAEEAVRILKRTEKT